MQVMYARARDLPLLFEDKKRGFTCAYIIYEMLLSFLWFI